MSSNNSHFVEKILERYKSVHKLRKWEDVASRIGVSPPTLSGWKSRNTQSNISDIIESCDEDVNLHWLLTGKGEERIGQSVSLVSERFSNYEASLNGLDSENIDQGEFLEFVLKQQEAGEWMIDNSIEELGSDMGISDDEKGLESYTTGEPYEVVFEIGDTRFNDGDWMFDIVEQ